MYFIASSSHHHTGFARANLQSTSHQVFFFFLHNHTVSAPASLQSISGRCNCHHHHRVMYGSSQSAHRGPTWMVLGEREQLTCSFACENGARCERTKMSPASRLAGRSTRQAALGDKRKEEKSSVRTSFLFLVFLFFFSFANAVF